MRRHFRRLNYNFRDGWKSAWRENRFVIVLLALSAIAGLVLGALVIFDPLLEHFRITQNLLDGNIINAASPNRGIFAFIVSRFADFAFAFVLVMLFSLSKWTVLLVFPYLAFRGFWVVINLFWVIDRFGFAHAAVLFFVYLIVLITLLIIFAAAVLFALRRGKACRMFGLRCGLGWREVRRPLTTFAVILFCVAVIEWLLYFLVLSRMVFVL
ncbi:MAG: hypothetical protein FWE38_02855 [Firmicutes bacterium]|nr:hypothetical protein [Bacillota bacterium]